MTNVKSSRPWVQAPSLDLTDLWRSSSDQDSKLSSLAVYNLLCHCLSISCCPPVLTALGLTVQLSFRCQWLLTGLKFSISGEKAFQSQDVAVAPAPSQGLRYPEARWELGIRCSWNHQGQSSLPLSGGIQWVSGLQGLHSTVPS